MSKWNKSQGVVVPLESLLKERRKENCPTPRRSAGLVGRWGITSFTSIRSRTYVAEYNNVDLKDAPGLELGTGDSGPENVVNLLGSNAAEPARPRKFFKSRNSVPMVPPLIGSTEHLGPSHSPYATNAGSGGGHAFGGPAGAPDHWNRSNATSTTMTPPQTTQHFYQPLSAAAATPQFSPTGPQSANVGLQNAGQPDAMAYAVQFHHQQQQQQQHQLYSMAFVQEPVKEKKSRRKKKNVPIEPAPKKEKKEKRSKKSKKKPPGDDPGTAAFEAPKRNSSRIRNRVVNYNEDEDSNDYERTAASQSASQQQPSTLGMPEYEFYPSMDQPFNGLLGQQPMMVQHQDSQVSSAAPYHLMHGPESSPAASGYGGTGYLSGGEGRSNAKPTTTTTVGTPQPSPTINEHRPILLRISKGTSMLISTDSEEVSTNSTPPTALVNQQPGVPEDVQPSEDDDDYDGDLPPRTLLADSEPFAVPDSRLDPQPYLHYFEHPENHPMKSVLPEVGQQQQQQEQDNQRQSQEEQQQEYPEQPFSVAEASPLQTPPKTNLKIKISLGGKPLISSTTTSAGGAIATSSSSAISKGSSKGNRYNFKKRAIERERARKHLSSKRRKSAPFTATNPDGTPPAAPVSSTVPSRSSTNRPSFPLPGTDTYEVFRTLSSLSGGDDFDSQSSIHGSASSDNTPKHTSAPGEDCQIIHSRGSSDCGSDLELSQNSSTAAAPPSDIYSESENTQDNNHHQLATRSVALTPATSTTPTSSTLPTVAAEPASTTTPSTSAEQPQPSERVQVLKLSLKNARSTRVTRNSMVKPTGDMEQQQPQQASSAAVADGTAKSLILRVSRPTRNRTSAGSNNNNNNDDAPRSSVSGKRTRKPTEATVTSREANSSQPDAVDDFPLEMPTHATTADSTPGTGQSLTLQDNTTTTTLKSGTSRQYSRRKKNVVPCDYLGEGSAAGSTSDLPDVAAPSTAAEDENGHAVKALDEPESRHNGGHHVALEREVAGAVATTEPAAQQAPPPMRLVLQKKGTIFKSRPLVSSSDGATDAKKRHVYKHKWDNDNGNGLDQAGGGPDAGSDAGGSVGGGVIGSVTEVADMLLPGQLLADGGSDPDRGAGDIGGGGAGGGGVAGGGAGTGSGAGNLHDYDDDFFDTDSSAPAGMVPRSKRLKMAAGSSGGGGSTSYGAGPSGSVGGGGGGLGSGFGFSEYDGTSGDGPGAGDENGAADEFGPRKTRTDRSSKPFYTIVRNVKNSHQMQEIGEFQEMDDDVDYILSALHPDNPTSTRCLSALQLATKCLKPAFKMHVRAHGVVTRFFRALSDAHQDASLGLCTAAIMYVFSQDKLNMDLDRDSLELMLNLLDTDHRPDGGSHGPGQGQLQRIRQRVKELCEEIKSIGKAKHIDTDRVTAGTLAMESLLSLTSQRAGEWFKDELRNLGGIEHLIRTVAECYEQVPGRAADWNDSAVAKLRKIERCLRVLNNVSQFNRPNQRFLLEHRSSLLVQLLVRLFRQVDSDLPHYPTDDATPKESVGVLLRELLQPILHMLITLTHSFDEEAHGAHLVGQQPDVIDITMHLLLRVSEYVPNRCVFDLHLLALTLLLHLARPSQPNRQQVLRYMDPETNRGGITALVEYFEQQEEMASHAEAKTNAILETPARTVDAEDAETKLMQKAEHHMEHTYMGSHVCMLICQLVMDEPGLEEISRMHLKNNNFKRMVAALSRYYEFLNLTTNADAESTAHKRQTKEAIDYLGRLDGCDSGIVRSAENDGSSASLCQ